jgi:outer membrane biosynthesis protein TonB
VENGILLKDAEEAFHQIFDTTYNYPYKKKFTTALLEAFKKAFLELDEYENPKNAGSMNVTMLAEPNPNNKKKSSEKEKKQASAAKDISSKPKTENKVEIDPEQIDLTRKISNHPQEPPKNEPPTQEINQEATQMQKEEKKELTEEEQQKELLKQQKKKRRVWGGKLYSFKNLEGENQADGSSPKKAGTKPKRNFVWSRDNSQQTRDLMTLMRKSVCAVLANQGFMIREVFVNEGEQIALIITTSEDNIEKMALAMGMMRKLDFGISDVVSLEPIDSKHRPMRLNQHLLRVDLWEKTYLDKSTDANEKKMVMKLRKRILKLLESEANFKQIARMCKSPWDNEVNSEIYDHAVPSLGEWIAYHDYLLEVSIQIACIKHSVSKVQSAISIFYSDKRVVLKGNKQRKVLDQQDLLLFTRLEVVAALNQAFINQNKRCKEGTYLVTSLFSSPHPDIVQKALDSLKKIHLKNLWGVLKTEPIEYEFPYFVGHNKMRKRNREFFDSIWKRYYFVNQAAELKTELSHSNGEIVMRKFSTPERIEAVCFLVCSTYLGQQADQPPRAEELF